MIIESYHVEIENPYERARTAFEELVTDLSEKATHQLTHCELETLIHQDGFEIMRLLLQGHLEERGPSAHTLKGSSHGYGVVKLKRS